MPGNIYYLVASLPHLRYPDPPPMTIDDFFSACKTHLSPCNLKKLKSIHEGDPDPRCRRLSSLKLWQEWDLTAREELARLRAERLGRPIVPVHDRDGKHAAAIDAAREAFRAATPIAADDTLESARWDYLDSLEFGRYFNIESLALYLLKLKVLARREGLIMDKGRAGFEGVLENRKDEIGVLMEEGFLNPPDRSLPQGKEERSSPS